MATINIKPAQRAGARLVICVAGPSGSGKTMTALLLAYGLAGGDGSKIGLLDTENKRGSLYADAHTYRIVQQQLGLKAPPDPFLVGDLEPPFSPRRYIDAIMEFQRAGVKVLVIDSVSHEWEGTGGAQEIANPPGANLRIPKWNVAKSEHKAFVNALLQCDMDIIVCTRAREKVRIEKVNGDTVVTPLGMLPICEKNFMFEMTASLMLWDAGKSQDVMKCPDELRAILGRGDGYITAADGVAAPLGRWRRRAGSCGRTRSQHAAHGDGRRAGRLPRSLEKDAEGHPRHADRRRHARHAEGRGGSLRPAARRSQAGRRRARRIECSGQ